MLIRCYSTFLPLLSAPTLTLPHHPPRSPTPQLHVHDQGLPESGGPLQQAIPGRSDRGRAAVCLRVLHRQLHINRGEVYSPLAARNQPVTACPGPKPFPRSSLALPSLPVSGHPRSPSSPRRLHTPSFMSASITMLRQQSLAASLAWLAVTRSSQEAPAEAAGTGRRSDVGMHPHPLPGPPARVCPPRPLSLQLPQFLLCPCIWAIRAPFLSASATRSSMARPGGSNSPRLRRREC